MSHPRIDIARIRRVVLVLFGSALCVMVWPFLQPLPARKPTTAEVTYPIENYPLEDPHTARDYDWFAKSLNQIGIESIRSQCPNERGERFLFAWQPTFSNGVIVTGIRGNDPAAPMRVTSHVLDNLGLGVQYQIIDTRRNEVLAWPWSAVASTFSRVLSPHRGATNSWRGADGGSWYLEWCNHGRYAYQSRWSPSPYGISPEAELVRLGERLARIGKVDDVFGVIYVDLSDY